MCDYPQVNVTCLRWLYTNIVPSNGLMLSVLKRVKLILRHHITSIFCKEWNLCICICWISRKHQHVFTYMSFLMSWCQRCRHCWPRRWKPMTTAMSSGRLSVFGEGDWNPSPWKSNNYFSKALTHWGRVTHIFVSKLTIICLDNGLSPGRRQAIIWTNAGILLIGSLGTNFNEISIKIQSRKSKWKRRLENGGHFVSASMC